MLKICHAVDAFYTPGCDMSNKEQYQQIHMQVVYTCKVNKTINNKHVHNMDSLLIFVGFDC